MSNSASIPPQIAKLIPLLATEHDGEVVATARAIDRILKREGLDLHSLVEVLCEPKPVAFVPPPPSPEKEPETWGEIARWCRTRDAGDLSNKERKFVWDMVRRAGTGVQPTDKQLKWLHAIHMKLQWGYVP